MEIFAIVYIFVALAFLLGDFFKPNSKISFVVISIIALMSSTIVGLRPTDAGYDTLTYISYYHSIDMENLSSFNNVYAYNFENDYLYKFWNYALNFFGADDGTFLYLTAFVSIFLFLFVLQKLFGKTYLLIFLFFYASPAFIAIFGNAIRQGLAMPFFLLSVIYFFEKKKYRLLLAVAATFLFHNYTGIILIITLIILKLLYSYIEKYKLPVLISILLIEPIAYFLTGYVNSIYQTEYLEFVDFRYLFHYSFILFIYLYLVYRFRFKIMFDDTSKMFAVYTIITFLTSFLWFNPDSFGRILYLGYPFLCFFLGNLASLYKQRWIPLFIVFVMFFIGIYFFTTPSAIQTLSSN